MTVLSYTEEVNLTDHHDFLLKLKDFAVTVGWTNVEFQQNVQWGVVTSPPDYGWIAGSESFLALESSGLFGNQHLHFRFQGESGVPFANHSWVNSAMFDPPGPNPLDFTSATHPISQTGQTSGSYNQRGLKPSTMEKAWFFGNAGFIAAYAKLDVDYVQVFYFGSPRPFITTETELNFINIGNYFNESWEVKRENMPWHHTPNAYYYQSTYPNAANIFQTHSDNDVNKYFNDFDALKATADARNQWTGTPGIRVLHQNMVLGKFTTRAPADDNTRALALWDSFALFDQGYEIGEKVVYGSKEFLVFPPNDKLTNITSGMAYRIL